MTLRDDSFGSVEEVTAYTRHILRGQSAFNSTTQPSVSEVEKMIDRQSAQLNEAIQAAGFAPSTVRSNSTAKLSCDDYVVVQVAGHVELTQPGEGFAGDANNRSGQFLTLLGMSPDEFVDTKTQAWQRAGIAVADSVSQGLTFTGLDRHSERSDPDDTTREQPLFRRHKFEHDEL